jgi:DNA-binding transcriptional MocR family regulator
MSQTTVSATRLAALVGSLADERPAYRALADRIRLLIADGRVIVGTRLPSERDLTVTLQVSRTTVSRAYAVLTESGYAVARQGSGTVAALPTGSIRRGTGASLFPAEAGEDVIDLTCAATRAPCGVAEAYAAALDDLPAYLAGAGYFTLGVPELRERIAARYTERGLPTSPDEILVTSGAVAGMAIAARAFLRTGDRVMIENPTYPNTAESLRRTGCRLAAVPVDATGWDTTTVTSTIAAATPKAAVVIPDFHNPTGAHMPDEQRATVAHALRRQGTLTLVDETITEVRLDDSAQALPFGAHLRDSIAIGSASKSHWGGLRLGWMRARADRLATLVDARVTIDLGAPVLEQLVLLHLLRQSPAMATERRDELVTARDALAAAVREALPQADFVLPRGGLSLWLHLPDASTSRIVDAAEREGLLLASGNRFAATGTLDRWLRLPYVLSPSDLGEAVHRLTRAVESAGSAPAPRPAAARSARPLVA